MTAAPPTRRSSTSRRASSSATAPTRAGAPTRRGRAGKRGRCTGSGLPTRSPATSASSTPRSAAPTSSSIGPATPSCRPTTGRNRIRRVPTNPRRPRSRPAACGSWPASRPTRDRATRYREATLAILTKLSSPEFLAVGRARLGGDPPPWRLPRAPRARRRRKRHVGRLLLRRGARSRPRIDAGWPFMIDPTSTATITTDIAIIGSGMGGGTLAYALRNRGAKVLIVERGGYLPREPENWSPREIFVAKRYRTTDPYLDGRGKPFRPSIYHVVGGLHQGLRRRPAALPARGLRGARERGRRLAGLARRLRRARALLRRGRATVPRPRHRRHATPSRRRVRRRSRTRPSRMSRSSPTSPTASNGRACVRSRCRSGIDLREGGTCIRCKTCDGVPVPGPRQERCRGLRHDARPSSRRTSR